MLVSGTEIAWGWGRETIYKMWVVRTWSAVEVRIVVPSGDL